MLKHDQKMFSVKFEGKSKYLVLLIKLVSLRKPHRHATYQEIMVYQSRGPQLANHKYTGKHWALSLCYICP